MNASMLIEFLGYSSIHPPLDDFLLANGIKKRPKKIVSTEYIDLPELKLHLWFQLSDIFDEESLVPKRSEGRFVFKVVTFDAGFDAPLPYGISLQQDKPTLELKLGKPRKENEIGPIAIYSKDGLIISINWNRKAPGEAFIRFALPTIYDKENLGI